jgi:hypothetical protein
VAAIRGAAGKVIVLMEIVPAARTTRFEQLEAGDLFMCIDGRQTFYALKTQQPATGDRSTMVLLGPSFIQDAAESFLVPWQPVTVLSLGKNFCILPSLDPASWSPTGPSRTPVCLAIAEENTYICTNGGHSPQHYFPCFVDVKTGAIVERRLLGAAAFTNSWEMAVLNTNHPPRSILKYPLP